MIGTIVNVLMNMSSSDNLLMHIIKKKRTNKQTKKPFEIAHKTFWLGRLSPLE